MARTIFLLRCMDGKRFVSTRSVPDAEGNKMVTFTSQFVDAEKFEARDKAEGFIATKLHNNPMIEVSEYHLHFGLKGGLA